MDQSSSSSMKSLLLVLYAFALAMGSCGCPLLARFYFVTGKQSFLHTAALPLVLAPLPLFHYTRRHLQSPLFRLSPIVFAAAAGIGALTGGLANYLLDVRLPVSTSFSLVRSMLLPFTALLGYLHLVKPYTKKRPGAFVSFDMVELVLGLMATTFCAVGMLLVNQDIATEARAYGLGEAAYFGVVVSSAILFKGFFLGSAGVVYYSSSLLSGVIVTLVLIPETETTSWVVVFFQELFLVEKAASLFLALWGFVSYFCGESQQLPAAQGARFCMRY